MYIQIPQKIIVNEKRKLIKLRKKKFNNNHKFIKFPFIIFLALLLFIEIKEAENISIFLIKKQENKQNNTNLYINENKDIKDKSNNQKEKEQNNIEYNKENKNTKNGNNTQKEKPEEVIFKTLHESFNSAKDFLDNGIKGILIQDKQKFILSENPLVSVVIPLYNCKKIILRALRSIQNQNIYNLEIILVDDFSKDDTVSFIENIKREDPRIKLINNKKSMGALYSRSIGALTAKGKYIFPLDNDDMFLDKDVFETITNIAESGSFDLVEFKGVESLIGFNDILRNQIRDIGFSNKELNLIMHQPELGKYPVSPKPNLKGYNINDAYVWGKCIKKEMYQKAINNLGEEKYSRFMLAHEDVLMIYILFHTIESYKYVGKYGIFHIKSFGTSWIKSLNIFNRIKKELFFLDAVIDFPKNCIESKILSVSIVNKIMGYTNLEKILNIKEHYKQLFFSCLDRIFNSTLISNDLKIELRKRGKKLSSLNYNF